MPTIRYLTYSNYWKPDGVDDTIRLFKFPYVVRRFESEQVPRQKIKPLMRHQSKTTRMKNPQVWYYTFTPLSEITRYDTSIFWPSARFDMHIVTECPRPPNPSEDTASKARDAPLRIFLLGILFIHQPKRTTPSHAMPHWSFHGGGTATPVENHLFECNSRRRNSLRWLSPATTKRRKLSKAITIPCFELNGVAATPAMDYHHKRREKLIIHCLPKKKIIDVLYDNTRNKKKSAAWPWRQFPALRNASSALNLIC